MKNLFPIIAGVFLVSGSAHAQDAPSARVLSTASDRRALSAIFDDRHIADNALIVHRRALKMPAEERFQYLSDWVLPGIAHDTIRVALDFTPTHPAPPVGGKERADIDRLKIADESGHSRVQIGGQLVSPALDLVEVAKTLGRLKKIRDRVDRFTPTNDQQKRSHLAMLVAIDTTRGDFAAALNSIDRLFSLSKSSEHPDFSDSWPEMLAVRASVRHADMREVVREMVYHIRVRHVGSKYPSGNEAWPFQILALKGLAEYFDLKTADASIEQFGLARVMKQWAPANDSTARSRGTGRPPSHWQLMPGSVENLAGHGTDLLYYQSPLRGNYAVECDATAHGWRDVHLSVAGTWAAPSATLKDYRLGGVRGGRPRGEITPKLTKPKGEQRLRTVVRDGVSTTYVNGRKIHEEPLPKDYVPWLAIRRSLVRGSGIIRNLRITGEPVIPERLRLTATENLAGWMSYFAESVGTPTSNWRQRGDLPNGGGIVGVHKPDEAGSANESLLYYHRPMLEDGEIEYEFFYRKGVAETHPALDRLAFMLVPDGVRVHWITDGPYGRTGLDPQNVFDEPQNRRGPDRLPLKPNAWNRLRLTLAGDTVGLILNDQLVYQRQLERTNQRTFGLFHYSDRTEARVRNVVWRGDWPRQLPSVSEQELAGEGADFLDEKLPELTAVFEHDFAKDGLPEDQFSVLGPDWEKHLAVKPDGIHVTRPGVKKFAYFSCSIAPRLKVQGDFDITASFVQLKTPAIEDGINSLLLMGTLNRQATHQFMIYRRLVAHAGRDDEPVVQSAYRFIEPDKIRREWFGTTPEESTSGTMRLARRGKKVFFLFAQGDSPVFRLISEQIVADDDLRLDDGIQLMTQTSGPEPTEVVWKNISIRAGKLSGLALLNTNNFVVELDKKRDSLADRFDHNFARDDPSADRLYQWGHRRPLQPMPDGLRVVAPGTDTWTSVGLAPQVALRGDFDIAVSLDALKFDQPATGKNSGVYLQIKFDDKGKSAANLIFLHHPDGRKEAYTEMETLRSDGKRDYLRVRSIKVDSIDALRIARRGEQLSFLFSEQGSKGYQLLSQFDVGAHDVLKTSIRLMLHTGGAGRETEVLWKQLSIRADEINPLTPKAAALRQALTNQLTGKLPSSALEFDGRTQYVTIPSIRYDGSHPITMEVFVTPDKLQHVVMGDTQQSGVDLGFPGQKCNLNAWNGEGYNSAKSEEAAARFLRIHLAGTFDGKTLRLFVDGKLMKTTQLNGKFTGSGFPMTIGASPSPRELGIDFPFAGVIDQVRISKTVRYAESFKVPTEFEADVSTLALFRFDEGKGQTLHDTSGDKHHGEIRGAKWVGDSAIRHRAALGLAEFGSDAVGVLIEALKHQNPDVRLEAVMALEMIGTDAKSAVPALKQLAKDKDQRVVAAAARAAAKIEGKTLLKSLRNLFN